MTTVIAVGAALALVLLVAAGVYIWAHLVPPLEAEATPEGLRVVVHRAVLRDLTISVDNGTPIAIAELPRGATVIAWDDFGLDPSPTLHHEVRDVHATGMSRFSRFETSISFIPPSYNGTTISSATAQTLNYISTAE